MAIGLGLGLGPRATGQRYPRLSTAFSAQAAGVGTVGGTFARAASSTGTDYGRASASTIFTAAANQPRLVWTPSGTGLLLRRSGTNLLKTSLAPGGANWVAGSVGVTTGLTGPDGNATAARQTLSSGQTGAAQILNGINGVATAWTFWVLRGAGTDGPEQGFCYVGHGTGDGFNFTATSTWTPHTFLRTGTSDGNNELFPWDGRTLLGNTASAVDTQVAFCCVEALPYTTDSPIVSPSGSQGTCGGDVLSYPATSLLDGTGRLGLRLRLRPYGSIVQRGAFTLAFADSNNKIEVTAGRQIKVTLGGVAYTAQGLCTWFAGDVVDVFIVAGGALPTEVWISINGGAGQLLGVGPVQAPWSASGSIFIGCAGGDSGQPDAVLQLLEAA